MRLFPLLALVSYLVPSLIVFSAWVPHIERSKYGQLANIEARATVSSATTADATSDVTTASATSHATATANATSTTDTTSSPSTTISSLNTSVPSKNETEHTPPGALPLQPVITPALGIGGFVLIATGAILAGIGIRHLWIQVFMSTAFLTSLGVLVLIVYVMNPPVRVAIQGAYLVAVFFTGVTFGAVALVFKELTEGLGCLLGGFCTSMWLLTLKPGGLLTETNAKSGFIGALSVAFYALSFSQYTRPYGLMASTGISGGTAVALGIDCYSRAGLKEFWLYIWALNDDVFPLGTDTYPVTRNIRVELAATVIVAILGVISQLRLWRVIRERRRKDEQVRAEEQKKKEESDAEVARRLEENNIKERMEWEAKYGNPGPKVAELAADGDLEKGDGVESLTSSSEESFRCSDCRDREANGESLYAASESSDSSAATEGSQTRQLDDSTKTVEEDESPEDEKHAQTKVFDGTAVAQISDDKSSDMTAIVGSDAGTIRSKRISRRSIWDKVSIKSSVGPTSQSQEALVPQKEDDVSTTQGIVDEGSDTASDGHTLATEGQTQAKTISKADSNEFLDNNTEMGSSVKEAPPSQRSADGSSTDEQSVYSREVEERKLCSRQQSNDRKGKQKDAVSEGDGHENCSSASPSSSKEKELAGLDLVKDQSTKGQSAEKLPKDERSKQEQLKDKQPEEQSKEESKEYKEESTEDKSKASSTKEQPAKESSQLETTSEAAKATDSSDKNPQTSDSADKPTSEGQATKSTEASQSKTSLETGASSKKSKKSSSKQKSSVSKSKSKSKSKKEDPAKLDAKTVKHIPQRASRMVQSYRTNEWAKHLADAEAPEMEPIEPLEEEQPERAVEVQETPAPVNVKELMQTPLDAQPPPAEIHTTLGSEPIYTSDSNRMSNDLHKRQSSKSKKRASLSTLQLSSTSYAPEASIPQYPPATAQPQSAGGPADGIRNSMISMPPIAAAEEQPQEGPEAPKLQWKGPPPLIAVREGLVRTKLSSFSLGSDPWSSRISPGVSPIEPPPRHSTFPIPEEVDNMPLSRRRTMLQQRPRVSHVRWNSQSSAPAAGPSPAPAPATTPAPAPAPGPSPINTQAAMAAWREYVREDLHEKLNPIAVANSPVSPTAASERNPFVQAQRNSSSVKIGNPVVDGVQQQPPPAQQRDGTQRDNVQRDSMLRGDMSDLHRDAMRRMQAVANRNANGI